MLDLPGREFTPSKQAKKKSRHKHLPRRDKKRKKRGSENFYILKTGVQ